MLVLRRLELRNILSHRDTSLGFKPGFTAFIGPNGSGKTSILEALLFSLTPHRSPRRNTLVTVGSGMGEIRLLMDDLDAGVQVEAINRLRATQSGVSVQDAILRVGGKRLASKQRGYQVEMHRLLNLRGIPDPRSYIENVVIIMQGGLQAIASTMADPTRFRQLLDAALGYVKYEEAVRGLSKLRIPVEGEMPLYVGDAVTPKGLQDRYLEAKARVQEYSRKAAERASKARKLSAEIGGLESRLAELRKQAERVASRLAELRVVEERLSYVRMELEKERLRLSGIEKRLAELRKQAQEAESLEREASKLEEVVARSVSLAEARRLQGRMVEASLKARELARAVEWLAEARRLAAIERELAAIERMLGELEKEEARARDEALLLEKRLSEAESLHRSYKALAARIERLLGVEHTESPRDLLETVRRHVEKIARESDVLASRLEEIRRERSQREGEIRRLEKAVEALEAGRGPEGRCPVCGSLLPPERVEELLEHYMKEAQDLRLQAERLAREEREASEKLSRLKEVERHLIAAGERLHSMVESLESLGMEGFQDLPRLRARVGELRERASKARAERYSLDSRRRELASDAGRLRELEGRAREYLKLHGVASLEEASRKLEELRSEVNRLETRIGELVSELARALAITLDPRDPRALDRLESLISDARSRLEYVRSRLSRLEGVREELARLEAEAREAGQRLERLESEARSLEARLAEKQVLEARLAELSSEAEKLESMLEGLKSEKARLEAEASEYSRRASAYREAIKIYLPALATKRILLEVKDVFYERFVEALEDAMNDILSRFDLAVAGVRIESSVASRGQRSIKVQAISSSGRLTPVTSLSGGEKTVLALSFVLAVNRVATENRLGFLALDEPTSELDEPRREYLVEVLRGLSEEKIVEQLLVVTHHDDVRDHADSVCLVSRDARGFSVVECS